MQSPSRLTSLMFAFILTLATTTSAQQTTHDKECNPEAAHRLTNSPGKVLDFALCKETCEVSTECLTATYYWKSKWCSHFSKSCDDALLVSTGASTVIFQPENWGEGWTYVANDYKCNEGQSYVESTSAKQPSLADCVNSCENSSKCKSLTYFFATDSSTGFCSHYSTLCEKKLVTENWAIAFRSLGAVTTTSPYL